jgi:hypothetical protein
MLNTVFSSRLNLYLVVGFGTVYTGVKRMGWLFFIHVAWLVSININETFFFYFLNYLGEVIN